MPNNDDKLVSIYTYWRKMVLLPSIIAAIIICFCAVLSLKIIDSRHQLTELKKIAWTISELIYDKIDSTKKEELSRIVFDVGKLHNVIITVDSPDNEMVASYPGVIPLIDKSLPFDLVYKEIVKLEDGNVLGQITIKKAKHLSFQVNDWILLGTVVLILAASLIWQLRFSRPMVSAVQNLSLDSVTRMNLKFKEVHDIYILLRNQAHELKVQELKNSAEARSVAQMSQMLAHDIRQPFTMLDGVISLFESADNASEIMDISQQYVPQVRKALMSVDGMIADVMQVGSNKPLDKEPTSIESIIESALNECFRFEETSNIEFTYQFNHVHQLDVDRLKIFRVFHNIIINAAEAMNFSGRIWFKTHETQRSMAITVGNSNTYIPHEERECLFEAFYTKKSKGTGLGLAIAQKIVIAHGGRIVCRSDRNAGTEFEFDLPVAKGIKAPADTRLPISNEQVRHADPIHQKSSDIKTVTAELANKIISAQQKIRILLADDEPFYHNVINEQINKNAIAESVQLTWVNSGEAAVEAARQIDPHIIIMDVDFGENGMLNGFEAVHEIRKDNGASKICIHSKHGALDFQRKAADVGSNLFLPKPMTLVHLMTIITESIPLRKITG